MPDTSSLREQALAEAANLMQHAYDGGEIGWRGLAEIAFDLAPDPDPIGRVEVADMLGCHRNNLKRDHPELPEPDWRIKYGPLWRRAAIEDYRARQRAAAEVEA